MKKSLSLIVLSAIFLLFIASVNAEKLPSVGSEAERDQWGNVLNNYLLVAHTENGTLKNNSVQDFMLNLSSITLADFSNDVSYLTVVGNPNIATGTITASKLNLTDITLADFSNDRADLFAVLNGTSLFNSLFVSSFNTNFSSKTTTDLAEGTNLYFTNARADSRFNSLFVGAFNSNLSVATINSNQVIGLGNLATKSKINNSDWEGTALAVSNGGIGATTSSGARTNLGLVIGTDVQAFDATLTSIGALGTASDKIAYTTGVDTWAETALTGFGRTLIDDADAGTARTTLGLIIGTNVQAFDAQLSDVAGLAVTDSNFIVGDGTNFIVESGATARASLGLGSLSTLSTITTSEITDGTIVNADVSGTAGITYGKLAFSNNIVAGDIATGAVETTEILDNTIAKADVSTGFIKVGNLADDVSGWTPDGTATSFTITADASNVGANSAILVSLGANADAGAVCGVTTRTASTNFVVGCASSPDNGATLQYAIIN